MAPGIPHQLMADAALVEELAGVAKDAALLHGVQMRTQESPNSSELVTYAPFTLFPSPVPRGAFQQALAVQVHYNTLVDRISQDADFLQAALASTVGVDAFTARLFKIHQQVLEEGTAQPVVLGLNRSDYMLDQKSSGPPAVKQVEINTFAASFGGLASRMPDVHRWVQQSLAVGPRGRVWGVTVWAFIPQTHPEGGWSPGGQWAYPRQRQRRRPGQSHRHSLGALRVREEHSHQEEDLRGRFQDRLSEPGQEALCGGPGGCRGVLQERLHASELPERGGPCPASSSSRRGRRCDGSVAPFSSFQAWEARLLMERSLAVKCPDIRTHLAGTKKVQQVLAQPGVLEKFFPEQAGVAEQIRATFAGLYTLDLGPEGDRSVDLALAAPDNFVLKPQREGGGERRDASAAADQRLDQVHLCLPHGRTAGNNLYGADLLRVLQEVKGSEERLAYILMEKITPAPVHNILLRRDAPLTVSACLCELGVFGAYVRKGADVVMNECVGHLLRTKSSEHADGGVAAGVAVLDDPL
ncbi:unnamed protein product, partial [Tetraodon nigroviridis]